jgi:hypothetical protein
MIYKGQQAASMAIGINTNGLGTRGTSQRLAGFVRRGRTGPSVGSQRKQAALDPHQTAQPWAVDVIVDHAQGDQGLVIDRSLFHGQVYIDHNFLF